MFAPTPCQNPFIRSPLPSSVPSSDTADDSSDKENLSLFSGPAAAVEELSSFMDLDTTR